MMTNHWRNRVVKTGEADPFELLENPANWRMHPDVQRKALSGVLDEIGWVDDVIINISTNMIVDGHLRVWLARERNEATIPVLYVDLTAEEQDLILSVFDPLAEMALADEDVLTELKTSLTEARSFVADILGDIQKARDETQINVKTPNPRGQGNTMLRIGNIIVPIPHEVYARWREDMYQSIGFDRKVIIDTIKSKVGL